jgi:hypothetical protein
MKSKLGLVALGIVTMGACSVAIDESRSRQVPVVPEEGYSFPVWIYPYGSEHPMTAVPCSELPDGELESYQKRYFNNDTVSRLERGSLHCAEGTDSACSALEFGQEQYYALGRYHLHYRRTAAPTAGSGGTGGTYGESRGGRCVTDPQRYLALDGSLSTRVRITSDVMTSTGVYTIGLFGAESSSETEVSLVFNNTMPLRDGHGPDFQVFTFGPVGAAQRKPLRPFLSKWLVFELRKEGDTCRAFVTLDEQNAYEFDQDNIRDDPYGTQDSSWQSYYANYTDATYTNYDDFAEGFHYRLNDGECHLAPYNQYWEDRDEACGSGGTGTGTIAPPGVRIIMMARADWYKSSYATYPNGSGSAPSGTVATNDNSYLMVDWVKWRALDPPPADLFETENEIDYECK